MTFPQLSLGLLIAICVLLVVVVLAVVQGPTITLGLIGALALARLLP